MKKFVHLIIFILILSSASFGQFKGGLKGGVNFCDMIITESGDQFEGESFNNRTAYHLGTYVQQTFKEQFAWQLEILFSSKGYVHELDGQKDKVSLSYINWPLLFIYKPIDLLEFELGPEFGFMVAGEETFSNFDLGIDIGARVNISEKFNAGLRYSYGFPFKMDMNDYDEDDFNPTYQNGVFQIYLGFNLISEKKQKESTD